MLIQLLGRVAVFATFAMAVSQPKNENDVGLIQKGEISLDDSEITLLINSTFEIIEGYEENNSTEVAENSTTIPEEVTTKEKTRPATRFHKRKQNKSEKSEGGCKVYTRKEKYQMLEATGSRNQLLMADSAEEASRGFVFSYPDKKMHDSSPSTFDPDACSPQCEQIKKTIEEVEKRNENNFLLHDAGLPEVDEGIQGCQLRFFEQVPGGCSKLGEEASWGYDHLCSECRGIYWMSENCFPRLYNAVKCNSQEQGCIFSNLSPSPNGKCEMETLSMVVLRNHGNSTCENWEREVIQLPVACTCVLSKTSFLRSTPPKEL